MNARLPFDLGSIGMIKVRICKNETVLGGCDTVEFEYCMLVLGPVALMLTH